MPPRKRQKAVPTQAAHITPTGKNTAVVPKVSDKHASGHIVRRRKGCLRDLPGYPIEIQLQIFGQLHPRDLLNLSRICKMFHSFFLHHSNQALWKTALANADDLPQRPPFLSELAFVHLLFSPYCHHCGTSIVRKVVWDWLMRVCPNCMPEVSYSLYEVCKMLPGLNDTLRYGQACNTYFRSHVVMAPFLGSAVHHPQHTRLLKSEVDSVAKELEGHQDWSEESCKVRDNVLSRLREEKDGRDELIEHLVVWWEEQEADRAAALDTKREQRFSQIIKCLKETGWSKELDFLGPKGLAKMSEMPVVRQSSKLTEGSWLKVLNVLNNLLHETREKRLNQERKDVLLSRFRALNEAILEHFVQLPRNVQMDCRPELIDLAMMEQCRALADQSNSVTVTKDDFAALVPTLATEWLAARKREILDYFSLHLGPIADDIDPLKLATSIIVCDSPSRESATVLRFPEILGHPCMRRISDIPDEIYARTAVETLGDSPLLKRTPFNLPEAIRRNRNPKVINTMKAIVTAIGLDPARAMVDDVRASNVRLRCCQCKYPDVKWRVPGVSVYSAEAAPHHAITTDYHHTAWERVSDDVANVVRELETKEHEKRVSLLLADGCVFACSLCVDTNEQWGISKHLKEVHNLDDATQCLDDGTIYPHPSSMTVIRTRATVLPVPYSR